MNSTTRLGLFAAAIILLAVALARPLSERFSAHDATKLDATALRSRLLAEEAARRDEFKRDPDAILAKIRALQAQGDNAGALRFASPYYSVNNPELTQLYRQLVAAEGRRLRLNDFQALMARDCNESNAGRVATDKIDHQAPSDPGDSVKLPQVSVRRLDGAAARAAIIAYLRDAASKPPDQSQDHGEHIEGPPRVHADFIEALPNADALPDATLCVWRVTGQRSVHGRARPFDFALWLAPAATGKTVESAIVAGSA